MSKGVAAAVAALCVLVEIADAFVPASPLGGMRTSLPRSAALGRMSKNKNGLLGASLTATSPSTTTQKKSQDKDILASRLSDMLKLDSRPERIGDKKTVIITGASSGIGLKAAIELANAVSIPGCIPALERGRRRCPVNFQHFVPCLPAAALRLV